MTHTTSPHVEPGAPRESPKPGTSPPGRNLHEPGSSSRLQTFAVWTVLLAVVGAAWHWQEAWLPWIGFGKANGAPANTKGAGRPVPVRTATAAERDMDLYLNALGTITADKTVTLRSRVEGELIKVAFSEGQVVEEGQLLAEIDPRPFEVQLEQAEGQLARDQATLALAKANLSRAENLLRSKAISSQEVEQLSATVKQTEAAIKTDQALVDNARLQLVYCKITAPIGGRIGLRMVDEGNIVRANDITGMAVITQLQPIALVFTIPQDDIPRVQKQMKTGEALTVEAWDRNYRSRLASGKLTAIDNQVDPTTGTLRLKATFENSDGTLFPNQFVNVRLLVETKKDAVVVPSAAVQRGPDNMFVYLVKPDETVELRKVVAGPTEGTDTSIESGLAAGDVVVTEGIDKLQPGSKVSTREKEKKPGDGKAAAKGH